MRSVAEVKKKVDYLLSEIEKVIVGQQEMIKQVIIALLTNSNVLVEGYPGLAKTMTVKTIASLMDLKFSRVQGTPDLMPSDITGTYIIEDRSGKREFKFQPGPIFANIVLMDEVNRATPKTQSALLEAMQEKQVTVGNSTFKLDEPFFVLATQNPIEQEGSLAFDQPVFIDGSLKTGFELIENAKNKKYTIFEENGKKLYNLPDSYTLALDGDGKLKRSKCWFYTLPYEGNLITLKTKQGRSITISGNHPFLVNEDGTILWKKAEELQEGDYLVSPARIFCTESKVELMNHKETINELSKRYNVVTVSKLEGLYNKTIGFEKESLKNLNGKEFDDIRIASELSVKELSIKLELNRMGYWRLVKFLRGKTKNEEIKGILVDYFNKNKPQLNGKDYVESFTINSIRDFTVDEDIAAWLAFLQSDGSIGESYLAAYQKNYPEELQRFVNTAKNKLGMMVSCIKKDTTGCSFVKINSKPLAEYFKIRFGVNGHTIPSWFISLPENLRRAYLRVFIGLESNFDTKRKRISFVQKDDDTTNIIRYMLLQDGIISWAKKKIGKGSIVNVLIIQGEDLKGYLSKVGWIDSIKALEFERNLPLNFGMKTIHRVLPMPRELIMQACKILGLNSFHAYKKRKKFLDNEWYFAYKDAQSGRRVISIGLLRKFVNGLKEEIKNREEIDFTNLLEKDTHHAAVLMGVPVTEIAKVLNVPIDAVCSVYEGGQKNSLLIRNFLKSEYSRKINTVKQIISYLGDLVSEDITYDRVLSLSVKDFSGEVYGLTVPELQNYIAGFGGCGINHNTYPLPEAQQDRFLFKVKISYPTNEEEYQIIDRFTASTTIPHLRPVIRKEELVDLQDLVRKVPISNDLKKEVVRIINNTRNKKDLIEYGASPRASIGLVLAAKARALIEGRSFVNKEDIEKMAYPILRHRIILSFEAEKNNMAPDDVIKLVLK